MPQTQSTDPDGASSESEPLRGSGGSGWQRYGGALTRAMSEVLAELPEEARAHALETADYWLSIGIQLGLERPDRARSLLELIEADEGERASLAEDAAGFIEEALG
ncbi:MAG: hypothetical protein EPN50_00560 [Chloroflexota bacterium]|nr:MAG: hypothetical protein EPN50_00560 [Chloroflexota bacterium]